MRCFPFSLVMYYFRESFGDFGLNPLICSYQVLTCCRLALRVVTARQARATVFNRIAWARNSNCRRRCGARYLASPTSACRISPGAVELCLRLLHTCIEHVIFALCVFLNYYLKTFIIWTYQMPKNFSYFFCILMCLSPLQHRD